MLAIHEQLEEQLKGEGKNFSIRKIVLENFKSYAGQHTVGPFTKVRSFLLLFR